MTAPSAVAFGRSDSSEDLNPSARFPVTHRAGIPTAQDFPEIGSAGAFEEEYNDNVIEPPGFTNTRPHTRASIFASPLLEEEITV